MRSCDEQHIIAVCSRARLIAAMLAPHLSAFFLCNRILAFGPGAVFSEHQSFRTFPNLACAWNNLHAAWCSGSASLLAYGLTEETDDAKGHRQMVQSDQGLWVH